MQIIVEHHLYGLLLGVTSGAFVAGVIFAANLLALRFGNGTYVIDLIIRFGSFALLTIPAAELFGYFFGFFVRQVVVIYFIGVGIGFVATPYIVGKFLPPSK